MAIGSAPEIGLILVEIPIVDNFLDSEALDEYYRQWREIVGDDLLGGYASLHEAPRYENGNRPETEQPTTTRESEEVQSV